jgi:hypothetical protein
MFYSLRFPNKDRPLDASQYHVSCLPVSRLLKGRVLREVPKIGSYFYKIVALQSH